jgi:hypothetical protein
MVMDKKMKNQSPEDNPQKKKNPKENIPLWLQGLSERHAEPEKEDLDEWRKEKEYLDEEIEDSADEDLDLPDEEPTEEAVEYQENETDQDELPDWLDELADVNPDTPEISGQNAESEVELTEESFDDEDEITEEINVIPDQEAVNIVEEIAEEQPFEQEGATEETPSLEEESFEADLIPDDEEIPEWLREMIAAEERQSQIQLESEKLIEEQVDEPTKPVRLEPDQEISVDEILDESEESDLSNQEIEIYEAAPRSEFQLIEDMIEEKAEEIEEIDDAVSSELQPIAGIEKTEEQHEYLEENDAESETPAPSEEQEETTLQGSTDETPELEQEQEDLSGYTDTPNGPVPKFLMAAKASLEKGNIDNALEIVYGFFTDSENLDQIKDWLQSAIEHINCDKSKLWEALGDIAIQQGNHAEAFNAYAKAIKNLENLKAELNETD